MTKLLLPLAILGVAILVIGVIEVNAQVFDKTFDKKFAKCFRANADSVDKILPMNAWKVMYEDMLRNQTLGANMTGFHNITILSFFDSCMRL
jgi:hypothetical protein